MDDGGAAVAERQSYGGNGAMAATVAMDYGGFGEIWFVIPDLVRRSARTVVVRRGASSFGEEFLRSTRSEEWPVSARSRSRNGGVAGVVRGVVGVVRGVAEDRTYCTRF